MVSIARRGEGDHRSMAAALQRGASAFEPRLPHAEPVRGSTSKRSVPSSNGPGRCGMWASAPWPVAQPAPPGAHAGSKGRRLKLAVVRRIRAGHEYLRSPYSSNSEIAELAKHFTKEAIRRGIWPAFVVAGLSVGRFLGKTDTEVLSYIDARITEAQLKPKSEVQDGV